VTVLDRPSFIVCRQSKVKRAFKFKRLALVRLLLLLFRRPREAQKPCFAAAAATTCEIPNDLPHAFEIFTTLRRVRSATRVQYLP